MIELRHLRYLVAVADEGHITRAAERLGIQQPPLTRQIRQLEQMVGARLFDRLPRGVRPTEAGRALVEEARLILAQAQKLPETARRAAAGEAGRIVIGYTITSAFHPFVTGAIRGFRESLPDVDLELAEDWTNALVLALREGRVDAAFTRSPAVEAPDLRMEHLFDDEMCAVVPTRHPLADAGEIPLAALASDTFVLYRRPAGPGLYDSIIAACQLAGFSPVLGQEAPSVPATLSLVAAGLGVSIVPAILRRMNVEGAAFVRLATGPTIALQLATRRGERSPVVERFRRAVIQAARAAH